MPKLLFADGRLSEDDWQFLQDDEDFACDSPVIVSVSRWSQDKLRLLQNTARLGLSLPNTANVTDFAAELEHFDLIALNFPSFTDGRAYSQARELREIGYTGLIRASGNVLHDQLFYMKRCGFDCFEYPENLRMDDIGRALKTFSAHYQAQFQDEIPLAGVFAES